MLQIEKIAYHGWQNCYQLSHSKLTMIVTTDVGPRIIYFGIPGEGNILHEFPTQAGLSGGDEWRSYGGHRLWVAPELPEITYFPDNRPVKIEQGHEGILLMAPLEESTGLQKSIRINIDPEQAIAHILHTIENRSSEKKTIAPWAVTVLRPGGTAILPQAPYVPWPDVVTAQSSLSLWSYTDMKAPQWQWGSRFILAKQNSTIETPQKIGMFNIMGWASYQVGSSLFVKRFEEPQGESYPDRNSNLEVWTNQECLELETLGPLKELEPGSSLTHIESWYLFPNSSQIRAESDVDELVMPYVDQCKKTPLGGIHLKD